ncbi:MULTISPECIES: nucleoside/nucleotide kinase family protein [Paenibacillus]|uniref:hypothetical protein n=1 Tax=Paenibacillus TaxID=44249 RepID=UPI0038993F16
MSSVKPYVISIAAVSGGGKTTVTNHFLGKLNNSKALYFDEYVFKDCPEDICDWVSRGANYNEWNLSPLIKDIQEYLKNESLEYILLDYPFAYLNDAISGYIDLTVFIDTPLDIAMARRILRDQSENLVYDLNSDLNNYLVRGRDAYLEMQKNVKPNSDIEINGLLPVDLIVDQLIKELRHRGL